MKTVIERSAIPTRLLPGVERAAGVLEEEALDLDDFDISAHWHHGSGPDGKVGVLLDLTATVGSERFELSDWHYPNEFFDGSNYALRQGFKPVLEAFYPELHNAVRASLRGIRRSLAAMVIGEDE